MKLGAALERVKQLRREKLEVEDTIGRLPLGMVPDCLDRYNNVVTELLDLEKKCLAREMDSAIDGKSLKDVDSLLRLVNGKISVLSKVERREDLSPQQRERLCEDLEKFRSTRDTLESSISNYLWEVELLDE